ncbi:MAG: proton-conducting transporter membrane subunit [bacterium]|nr:proton-conducting transporter membrane subunit [bacterium]
MSIIPLFIAVPLGAAFLMPILNKASGKISDWWANGVNLFLLILSLSIVNQGVMVYEAGGWKAVEGIPIGIFMVVDGLSILMLVGLNLIAFAAGLYSINYMDRYTDKARFYTLSLLLVAGMNGVVLAGDLFNLFVFMEITAISSYALVCFGLEDEGLEAAFKYQVMGGVASAFILLGIALLYSLTGTLNMADMSRIVNQGGAAPLIFFVSALFIAGFGLKAGLMPFHAWLPDAHPSAPAPISALLSGVIIKTIGVYALIRVIFNVLGEPRLVLDILLILGTISMLGGSLLALRQEDIKRVLAYSSISQVGYIALAIGLGTPMGYLGALLHLINHACAKSLLFLNSGAVVYAAGTRELSRLGGLRERMPVTSATSLVATFSIVGIPPFGGFWSKLLIIMAAILAGHLVLASLAVLASILTLAYYLRLQKETFFGQLKDEFKAIREVPALMCFSMIILAFLCTGMGLLLLPRAKEVFLGPAAEVLGNSLKYASTVL